MFNLETLLKNFGLSDHEATVFSALASSSPASATQLAKKCGFSRSSVYTILAALIAKGLVATTYKNEIKQFLAQDSSAFEQILKKERVELAKKQQLFNGLQHQLAALSQSELNIPQTIFFEGQEGLKRIYLSMMRQAPKNATLYLLRDEFVWRPEWQFIFEQDWHDRVKRLKQEKAISTRLLVNRSPTELTQQSFYRSKKNLAVHFLPKEQSVHQFAMYILGDVMSILSLEDNNLIGLKITNQHLANNFKRLFDLLWQRASHG